jgi:hypothetical protein
MLFANPPSTVTTRPHPSLENATPIAPIRVRRFVHRHSCVGVDDADGGDSIGCAESELVPFEHMIVPTMLWCDSQVCTTEFNETYSVHEISCTPRSCSVRIHCAESLVDIKRAGLATLGSVILIIGASFWCRSRDSARTLAALDRKRL